MTEESRTSRREQPQGLSRRRAAIAGGTAVALLLGAWGVSQVMSDDGKSETAESCTAPETVKVVTTSDMYAPVFAAADRLEQKGESCVTYDVSAANAGATAQQMRSGTDVPDVWIPDSDMWVDDVSSHRGDAWATRGGVIATTPVVLGVPASLSQRSGVRSPQSWGTVLDGRLPVATAGPRSSTPSLAAIIAANQYAGQGKPRSALLRQLVQLSRDGFTPQFLLAASQMGADKARLFPVSEQQLSAYRRTQPGKPLSVLVPQEGAPQLSYRWVTPVKKGGAPPTALEALREELVSPDTKSTLANAGFRVQGQSPPTGTGVPNDLKMAPAPPATLVASTQKAWTNLSKDARMLVLLDVSGSMLTPVKQGQTRVDLLRDLCIRALDALPQGTALGGWAFSTDLGGKGTDYVRLAPELKPISDPAYKKNLTSKIRTMPSLAEKNGDTGLYDSIGAAYQHMVSTYDDKYVNSVVVLTDGKNDDPGGGLDLKTLLGRLKGQYDPKKPVKIVAVSMGEDTDPKALQQIASQTDGLSYTTKTPEQVTSVFIDAFLRRGE